MLAYHAKELSDISFPDTSEIDVSIAQAEAKIKALGIDVSKVRRPKSPAVEKKVMLIPTWNQMVAEAQESCGTDNDLESLFTAEKLQCNREAMLFLNLSCILNGIAWCPSMYGWLVAAAIKV